jgi:GxxExxY protein
MENELVERVIQAAIEVHRVLGGPGLLESIYESALCHELALRGLECERQLPIPVLYKGTPVREPLYLDVIVENKLIIEIKASGKDYPFYQAQLFTYLRMLGIPTGLLINFGKKDLLTGVSRICADLLPT